MHRLTPGFSPLHRHRIVFAAPSAPSARANGHLADELIDPGPEMFLPILPSASVCLCHGRIITLSLRLASASEVRANDQSSLFVLSPADPSSLYPNHHHRHLCLPSENRAEQKKINRAIIEGNLADRRSSTPPPVLGGTKGTMAAFPHRIQEVTLKLDFPRSSC